MRVVYGLDWMIDYLTRRKRKLWNASNTLFFSLLFIHADLKLFSVALLQMRLNSEVQLGILSVFISFNRSKLYRLKARRFDFLTETVNMRNFGFGFRPKEVI